MYVCICKQVTDKQIKTAIDEGAQSVRDLRNELGVASQCGQCGHCAKAIIKEHKACASPQLPRPQQIPPATPTDIFPLFGDVIFGSD